MAGFDESQHNRGRDGRFANKVHAEAPGVGLDGARVVPGALPGGECWQLPDGTIHRTGGPAVTRPDGTQEWYDHGDLHREDGPARVMPGGGEQWFQHNRPHRIGGPAVSWPDGYEEWWVDGEPHRDNGPAVTHSDGDQEWWRRGKRIPTPQGM